MPTDPRESKAAEIRELLWRALGEASRRPPKSPPYLDRLMAALERHGLEVVRRV